MEFSSLVEELLYQALRIRMVEERIIEIYPSDKIQSPVHLSIGQEMVAVGACRALRSSDLLFGNYRNHAFYLAKGGSLKAMMAELYGRRDGCAGGKAGSMHLSSPDVGVMGASAVVASTIPHAVGAALAAKQLGRDQVCVAAFGDGATEEGPYHESLNFAALRRLPVIFLCENNGLACHSRIEARQAYSITEHAQAYGIPVTSCADSHDGPSWYALFSEVVEAVRRDGVPHFVEVQTYRYREHVGPGEDYDAGYRSLAELKSWQERDPILQNPDLVEKFRPFIEREIDDAVEFAERSPLPGEADLLQDVM